MVKKSAMFWASVITLSLLAAFAIAASAQEKMEKEVSKSHLSRRKPKHHEETTASAISRIRF
jgi:hypothetical protein